MPIMLNDLKELLSVLPAKEEKRRGNILNLMEWVNTLQRLVNNLTVGIMNLKEENPAKDGKIWQLQHQMQKGKYGERTFLLTSI